MTRSECKAEVLRELGQALGVTAGPDVDANWAPAKVDEVLDVFFPDPAHEFSESDVAAVRIWLREKWAKGKL